jgi:hypothetical protein
MKVIFEMDEKTVRDTIDAINHYLEMCDSPIIHCQNLTEEDKEDMEGLELCLAAALVGDELHKAVHSQTDDEFYKSLYKRRAANDRW